MALLEQVLAFDYGPKTRLAEWLDTKLGKGEDYHLIDSVSFISTSLDE